MNKRLEELIVGFLPALEEFVDEVAKLGVFLDDTRTLQINCQGCTVYFGDKEIKQLTIKAKRFDEVAEMVRMELENGVRYK
jgi:hypothetical protein